MSHIAKHIARIGSIALAFAPAAASAQTLQIAPITVELPAGRMASTIRITNRGDQPTTIQIRPFSWSQNAGAETLDPTVDLLASPPFATLAPGDSQTVRVVLRKPAVDHEMTYRLLVDQLPPAAAPGSVRVALRISLPVFAGVAGDARPNLSWSMVRDAKPGTAILSVRNDGKRRARVSNLRITAPGATLAPIDFAFKYVLAGSRVPIQVRTGGALPTSVHVVADSDQGRIEADAPVANAPR